MDGQADRQQNNKSFLFSFLWNGTPKKIKIFSHIPENPKKVMEEIFNEDKNVISNN